MNILIKSEYHGHSSYFFRTVLSKLQKSADCILLPGFYFEVKLSVRVVGEIVALLLPSWPSIAHLHFPLLSILQR